MQIQIKIREILVIAVLALGTPTMSFAEGGGDGPLMIAPEAADFKVTAAPKEENHPFYKKGNPLGFIVNEVPGKTLTLVRGKMYSFYVDTGPMHDFYISKNPQGWGGGTVTEGVDGNFTYKGIVTFKPGATTPDHVYYACRNHQFMGGEIQIVNPGEEGKAK